MAIQTANGTFLKLPARKNRGYAAFDALRRRRRESADAVGVGVIGYGYWGPNLVRNFSEVAGTDIVAVSDMSMDRLGLVHERYPTVKLSTRAEDLFADPDVEAVVIATPVSSHFRLALAALEAGKHVLVTKPMTASAQEAERLIEEAERRDLVLMVDHTFMYTGAVRRMKQLIDGGELGCLYYYDSVRVNLGLFQHDVDVLWDLAVHDLSIMDYLIPQQTQAVAATGIANLPGQQVNVAYLTCFFDSDLIAHQHVSWLAPVKVRRTLIGGDRQMIVYDDLEPSEKVKLYDKGVTVSQSADRVYESMVGYRSGDMWAPQLAMTEALRVEAQHFAECIRQGVRPITDAYSGLRVVRILEAATSSLARRGLPVEIPSSDVARAPLEASAGSA